jgi:DNA-binding GntR family transcriptional regulator
MDTGVIDAEFHIPRVAAPLRASVTEAIRSAIAVGRFRPGERLPERELCEMAGVSRTVVREVLRQLESEGLVQVLPHKGPIVARLSSTEAEGVYRVRSELEGLAAELFTAHATDGQRAALRSAFAQLQRAVRGEDPVVVFNARRAFYDCLVAGSGNDALVQMLRILNSRITVLRSTALAALGSSEESLVELGILVDAVAAGDGQRARDAARNHVNKVAALTVNRLRAQEADELSRQR